MQSPKIILEVLSKNNSTVNDIYKYLYNPEFYQLAYDNLCSRSPQMMRARKIEKTHCEKFNQFVEKTILKFKDKSYQPKSLSQQRGPSFEDKIVHEILCIILEAIYDHTFSDSIHGYRSEKNVHTALKYVQQKFQGTKWWISIDVESCFNNVDHKYLLNVLSKRIKEQRFIGLINKFLKAGYFDLWKYDKTYSGTPIGPVLSQILMNVYFYDFDKYMTEFTDCFWSGKSRKRDKEYRRLEGLLSRTKKSGNEYEIKKIEKQYRDYIRNYGCYDFRDPNFRRASYVRYANKILIGVIASKKETESVRELVLSYLKDNLNFLVASNNMKLEHNSELIRFLGYDLSVCASKDKLSMRGLINLWLPYDVCRDFIIKNKYGKNVNDKITGKSKLKAIHKPELLNDDDMEILMQFNVRMHGLYNYYKMASNVCKLAEFNYICQLSFLRTLAGKYKTSCKKLYNNKKYNHQNNGAHLGITYSGKFYTFFNGPFRVEKKIFFDKSVDIIPNPMKYSGRTSMIQRVEANRCEFCADHPGPFEIHHIDGLSDIKDKPKWLQHIIARKRKTITLCVECHRKLHAGKL